MKNEATSEVLKSLCHNLYVITLMFFMSGLGDPFHLKTLILFTSKPCESVVLDPRVLLGSPWMYPIGYLRYPEAILACEPNGLCQGDIFPPICWHLMFVDEKNCVCSLYLTTNALS